MRILVTGGSGFVGASLVGALGKGGHSLTVFDRAKNALFPSLVQTGDVRHREDLCPVAERQEAIFHLAAEHRDDVSPISLYEEVNVRGAENVVYAAKQADCKRIIFTSSVAVYPLNAGCPDETATPAPFNPYGASKLAAEQVFQQWAAKDPSVSLVIVRPCVVFGEGNRGNVYNLLKQVASGTFLMIGGGQNRKSLAYVGNLVPFLVSCLQAPPGVHLYNYADKPDLTTNELIAIARQALGRKGFMSRIRLPYFLGLAAGYGCDVAGALLRKRLPISSIRIKKFCAETTVATAKLEREGFKRPFTLEEGLRRMIAAEFGRQAGVQI